MQTGQSGGGDQPKPPVFRPIDVDKLDASIFDFTSKNQAIGKDDLATRFPGIVSQDNQQMADDAAAIGGPTIEERNAFLKHGIAKSLNSFGGPMGVIGDEGSISRNNVATTVAKDTLTQQDTARK